MEEEEADIDCSCKERNWWNCSSSKLVSTNGPGGVVAILSYGVCNLAMVYIPAVMYNLVVVYNPTMLYNSVVACNPAIVTNNYVVSLF